MLLSLNLKNFAIIDDLSIDFGKGLNIITGETGAGKSIIVDAINIILGDRASSDLIKSGQEEAQVEALFDIGDNKHLKHKLESLGFEPGDDQLLIRRILSRRGKGRVFIGGNIATYSMLEQLTEGVVDVLSQHEHQTLLKEDKHLQLLDEFGGLRVLTEEFGEVYKTYIRLKKELEECESNRRTQVEREDFLRFQCAEIDAARLQVSEDEMLEEERKRLANAEKLYSITQEAYEALYEGEKSVFDTLKRITNRVEEAVKIDDTLLETAKSLEKGIVEIQDASFTLRQYAANISFDPDRLNYVDSRLQEIRRLKKKYGGSIEEILQKREHMEEELRNISGYEGKVEDLQNQLKVIELGLDKKAYELSEKRQASSRKLMNVVEKELEKIGIKNARFVVDLTTKELSYNGRDKVAFLFSGNPDENPKPLTRVASGGELSRIMLVLKEVLARVEGGLVLIFDEADSGIGGAIAEAVGRKIKNLSQSYQVICITHLPQVAKFADTHFTVTKTFTEDSRTRVEVKSLGYEERVKELARMLGGLKVTEKTLEVAREMIRE
jgi:DNA repair protein RecN (Recombination protein N)